jgi:hypothetical protein
MLWSGSEEELIAFLRNLNNFHPFLNFKAYNNIGDKSVEFLATMRSITNEGFIKTKLHVKPGKRCTYLINSSCQPKHICENILLLSCS